MYGERERRGEGAGGGGGLTSKNNTNTHPHTQKKKRKQPEEKWGLVYSVEEMVVVVGGKGEGRGERKSGSQLEKLKAGYNIMRHA